MVTDTRASLFSNCRIIMHDRIRSFFWTALGACMFGMPVQAALVFFDNFDNCFHGEPGLVGSVWPKWPNATDHMNAWNNMNHTPGGTTSIRQDPEDPATLANYHDFGAAAVAVTATAWLFDNNSRLGVYAFPINFFFSLYGDSASGPTGFTDYLQIGLAPLPLFTDYNTYGYRSKSGGPVTTSVNRTNAIAGSADASGWIKFTIHADSLASGGHVGFYINDVLVGTASRMPGVDLRYFFMGTQSKNYEFFWVDDVSIDVAIPQITSMTVSGGTVTIHFISSDASELASAFSLVSSSLVNGVYSPAAGAAITGSGGSYQAKVPMSGDVQFYRIQR
jgi:hypothetical protein